MTTWMTNNYRCWVGAKLITSVFIILNHIIAWVLMLHACTPKTTFSLLFLRTIFSIDSILSATRRVISCLAKHSCPIWNANLNRQDRMKQIVCKCKDKDKLSSKNSGNDLELDQSYIWTMHNKVQCERMKLEALCVRGFFLMKAIGHTNQCCQLYISSNHL